MSTSMRIKQLADRTGFTPATLRYYEELGVLPAATRTASGYREYDGSAVDRLAFISRAKQLGCTLDEIAELTVAWEGGRCGDLQDRLRPLVQSKLSATHQRIDELQAFSADLQQAARALERHRPEGACDDQCGCLSSVEADAIAGPQPVAFGRTRDPRPTGPQHSDVPIACTLTGVEMTARLGEWTELLTHAQSRSAIPGGLHVHFAASVPTAELIRLTTAEQDCCRFFEFAVTVDRRGVGLDVVAPPDAQGVLEGLFGVPA